jgi:D-tagatose-1,6-bisphosphate aldolase subunit GatZ/KbaZ
LVIQPGVEFGDAHVHDFVPSKDLASTIEASPGLVYEAHSTDYQSAENLDAMVRNHYFVLKVGPWLTFALREGLFALEMMEKELSPGQPSNFRQTLLSTMKRDPGYWKKLLHRECRRNRAKAGIQLFRPGAVLPGTPGRLSCAGNSLR